MSQAQIESKVHDYLRKSQALQDYWQQPITSEQLQAEMDRMAKAHQTARSAARTLPSAGQQSVSHSRVSGSPNTGGAFVYVCPGLP